MAYYLDLFNGNPETTGYSVLGAITGSTARLDVTADLVSATSPPITGLTNPDSLSISADALAVSNISFAGLYSASSGGSLLKSARLGASPTINKGNPVKFDPLALTFIPVLFSPQASVVLEFTFSGVLTVGEIEYVDWGAISLLWGSSNLIWGYINK